MQHFLPTATFRVLFVLVVLAHHRRRVVHFNVTEHPTAARAAQQMVEAFPEDVAPRYLLRDRDKAYGEGFRNRVRGMQNSEVLIAPQIPHMIVEEGAPRVGRWRPSTGHVPLGDRVSLTI